MISTRCKSDSLQMATVPAGDRNPFVCPSCDTLYSSSIDCDSAPCHLIGCSHTLCTKCVTKKKRMNKDRETSTIDCAVCNSTVSIEKHPVKALSLMDVIHDIANKKISPVLTNVCIEPDDLPSLKCAGCGNTFDTRDRLPDLLCCGHAVCVTCFEERKVEDEEEGEDGKYGYKVQCWKCDECTYFDHNVTQGAHMQDVVRWLEKKKEEHVQSLPENQFVCGDCGIKTPSNRGILCNDCTADELKKRVLCGYCHFTAHRGHDSESYLSNELDSLESDAREARIRVRERVIDAKVVWRRFKELMAETDEKFLTSINRIPLASQCSDGTRMARDIERMGDRFEDIINDDFVPAVEGVISQITKLSLEFATLMDTHEKRVKEAETQRNEKNTVNRECRERESEI